MKLSSEVSGICLLKCSSIQHDRAGMLTSLVRWLSGVNADKKVHLVALSGCLSSPSLSLSLTTFREEEDRDGEYLKGGKPRTSL